MHKTPTNSVNPRNITVEIIPTIMADKPQMAEADVQYSFNNSAATLGHSCRL